MNQGMIKVHIRKPSMDQHALSKLSQRLPGPFCKMVPLLMLWGSKGDCNSLICTKLLKFLRNSVPASLLIFSISQKINPLINLCSAAKVLKAAMTDCELLLRILMILVNLENTSTRINRAGKFLELGSQKK
jgi:hypothetical protein